MFSSLAALSLFAWAPTHEIFLLFRCTSFCFFFSKFQFFEREVALSSQTAENFRKKMWRTSRVRSAHSTWCYMHSLHMVGLQVQVYTLYFLDALFAPYGHEELCLFCASSPPTHTHKKKLNLSVSILKKCHSIKKPMAFTHICLHISYCIGIRTTKSYSSAKTKRNAFRNIPATFLDIYMKKELSPFRPKKRNGPTATRC